ncbi:MAG: hypothetical protein LBU91_01105 [Bacteroidales bacterium]|jgi:hypothetical protein|nr:hypothetical protein [Bacteroidales bacterium]
MPNKKPYNINPKQDSFVEDPALAYAYDTLRRDSVQPYQSEQLILEPDEDLRRAITMDELLNSTLKFIDELYAEK